MALTMIKAASLILFLGECIYLINIVVNYRQVKPLYIFSYKVGRYSMHFIKITNKNFENEKWEREKMIFVH